MDLSRRDLIHLGVTAGFALSVSPPSLFAITTPDDGLHTETVQIPGQGTTFPCYLAMPKKKGKYPVVIVVHEIFGVHAYIQDVCRRFAKLGYVAVSPYLYFRHGDVTKIKEIDKVISEVVSKVPQSEVFLDLDSTVNWLKARKDCDTSRMGITGFCWGGNVTWMYSHHNPNVRAGAAWYGKLVSPTTPPPPNTNFPVDIATNLHVPVIGFYGGKDKGIPLDSVEKMRSLLSEGKTKSEIVVYPEAEHGFHADYRPSYNEAAANDAWAKLLAWFKKYGVA